MAMQDQVKDEYAGRLQRDDGTFVSCNWGLVASLRAKAKEAEDERLNMDEDRLTTTYRMSYCRPCDVIDKKGGETNGTGGRCMGNSQARKAAARSPPCAPGLIREFRPDTHSSVLLATRFDHHGHSMSAEPTSRCDTNVGVMIDNLKTFKEASVLPILPNL